MICDGKEIPKVFYYKDGKLVFGYILPKPFKSLEDLRQYHKECIIKSLGG